MIDSTVSSTPGVESHLEGCTPCLHILRRAFGCGHPDEFIEVQRDDDSNQIHNLITFEVFQDRLRRFGNLPAYTHARCLNCAKEAKEQDDKDPSVRSLRVYQAGTSSSVTEKRSASAMNGFDGVLERYRHCKSRNVTVRPHKRVSEAEHRAFRLEMQAEAVKCSDIAGIIPSSRQGDMPHMCKDTEVGQSAKPEEDTGQGAVDVVKGLAQISLAHTSGGNDESFRMAAVNTISLSGSKLERQNKRLEALEKSDKLDPTATNSDDPLSDRTTEAHRPQNTPGVASLGGGSASVKNLIKQNGPPVDDPSNSPLTCQRFEHPRPAPVLPKRGPLNFTKRRSSISTGSSTKVESLSKNFRKLRLDVHSPRFIKKTELDSDSPDFACRTSLAIETSRISMDSVSIQSRESMKSKHVVGATCSPGERRNTYPSPSGERSPASSRYGRHSEGAPQALREVSAAHYQSGRLDGMEIFSPLTKSSRHNNAQVALAMDLNKSSPALPAQESKEDEEE